MKRMLLVLLAMVISPWALAVTGTGDKAATATIAEDCFVLRWQESAEVAALFAEAGVSGTFAVYDVANDTLTGFDHRRVKQRFVPASTFKIVHTLIGLEQGAVVNVDEVLAWDGSPQPFKDWERDMSLREAIAVSNASIYQQLARRIGRTAMQREINRLGYGNRMLGEAVDRFWLDGPLQISLLEQLRVLAELAAEQLPYSGADQRVVAEIIRQPAKDGVVLYAKSGWQNAPQSGVGWWLGWLVKEGNIYAFGMNMDMSGPEDAAMRESLARRSLQLLGLL